MAKERSAAQIYDKHGHPRSPWQFQQEIRRADVADIKFRQYVDHLHLYVTIPCMVDGERKELKGHVSQVMTFHDGTLVSLMPLLKSDFYKPDFKLLMLWIPNEGDCGIL
jgi:hypothetical protein